MRIDLLEELCLYDVLSIFCWSLDNSDDLSECEEPIFLIEPSINDLIWAFVDLEFFHFHLR